MIQELDEGDVVEDKLFTGYENEPRRLPLARSGASIRCVFAGIELSPLPGGQFADEFAAARPVLAVENDKLLVVPQVEIDGRQVDTSDHAAGLLRFEMAALGWALGAPTRCPGAANGRNQVRAVVLRAVAYWWWKGWYQWSSCTNACERATGTRSGGAGSTALRWRCA